MVKTTAQGIVNWVAETNDRWVSSNASTRVEKNTGREIYTALRYRIEATPFTLLKTIDDVVGCLVGISSSDLHNHPSIAKHWPS